MTVTTLDPTTALVVVDLQKGTTAYPSAHPIGEIIARSAELVDAFRKRALPVVLVCFDPSRAPAGRSELGGTPRELPADFAELVPQLVPEPEDILLVKGGWSAFAGTGLADTLRARGVTQVVLVGVATTFGVESTARQAYDAGFNVTIAVDAITDPQAESHDRSVNGVFRVLGETGTTAEIRALLDA